ncbi:MAG TPA: universal stress protein, partial [Rhodothermales bacterium]|nr:universal stress protein [Rhodothermales bacterium]
MRRLVVPTDFSPFAAEALRYASALAERSGAEVHVLHVVSPTAEPPAT